MGNRIVTHPSWLAFWETNQNPTDENIYKWFRDEDYAYPPNEEIPCMECGGTGVISCLVDISEVLQFIEDRITNLESALFQKVNS